MRKEFKGGRSFLRKQEFSIEIPSTRKVKVDPHAAALAAKSEREQYGGVDPPKLGAGLEGPSSGQSDAESPIVTHYGFQSHLS